jgi:AbrB family looped-hinge helix DNA binding protein
MRCLAAKGKGMARISNKNQITIPVAALDEVGLHAGERVTVEPAGDGELAIRRATTTWTGGAAPLLPRATHASSPQIGGSSTCPRQC